MTDQGTVFMFVRLGLQAIGGFLVARGIGDEALWSGVSGALISAAGGAWSYAERRKLKAAAS
jgi:hypothetical protein